MRATKSLFRRFMSSSAGNAAMLFALTAAPLVIAAGGAMDFARHSNAKSAVSAALDAAVLAAAQELATNGGDVRKATEVGESFYEGAVKNMAHLDAFELVLEPTDDGEGMSGTVSAKMPTTLLRVAGFEWLDVEVTAESKVGYASPSSDLEVAVMLDVTGSMCDDGNGPCTSGSKISALKSAAKTLVEKVVWEDQSEFTSRVALVPFSTRVRVEPDGRANSLMQKLTGLQPTWSGWYKYCSSGSGGGGTSEGGGSWSCTRYTTQYYNNWKLMPCVTDRFYNSGWKFDFTDDEPVNGKHLNAHDGSRMTEGEDSSNARAIANTGNRRSNPATHWNYDSTGTCHDVSESNQVLPLTNDVDELNDRIDALVGYGSTAGVLGTAFSWYILSPNFKNIWTGQSKPKSYDLLTETNLSGKPKLRKVAVLMTDGVYNTYRGWKDQDKSTLATAAKSMCTAMKAKDIEIFTVGFDLDSLSSTDRATATDVLRSCGTSVDHFYQSINAQQLANAFEDIGNKVNTSTLRLTR